MRVNTVKNALKSGQPSVGTCCRWAASPRPLPRPLRLRLAHRGRRAYQRTLATTHNNLAGVLQGQGRKADALAEYRSALDVREKMAASFPATPTDKVHLGGNYCNIGVALEDKPEEALPWYDRAVETLRPVLDRDPRNSLAATFLRNSYLNRAAARAQLSRYKEAVADYDKALAHVDVGNRLPVRVRRVLCLAWVEPAEAAAEAEDLLKGAPAIGVPRVMAARVYSAAAGAAKDPELSKQYLGRALGLLREARDLGHFRDGRHIDEVMADPHLAVLRRQADLAALARGGPPKRD
ncbi:MAG: tetratricopeptide repeat protein [Gemmataceae bacterium]